MTSDSDNYGQEILSAIRVIKKTIELNRLPEKNVYACACTILYHLSEAGLISGIDDLFDIEKVALYVQSRGTGDYSVVVSALKENCFSSRVAGGAFLAFVIQSCEKYPEFA